MKKILLLTDFSANAAHAAKSALSLAKQWHTGVILYHSTLSIPVVPNYAGGGFVTETANLFAEESREKLAELQHQLLAGSKPSPALETEQGEGDLGDNVKKLIRDHDIELIVMGAPEGGALDHLLTGSETRAVIKHTERPVLVIPATKQIRSLKNFVLATDYREADLCAVRYLCKWVAETGGRLDIVHIQTGSDTAPLNGQQRQVFEFFLSSLKYNNVHCHDLRGKAVLSRLNRFCEDKQADVLAMINYHHDFFSRLFGTSETFKALHHLQLPLLVFPGNFSDETICPM